MSLEQQSTPNLLTPKKTHLIAFFKNVAVAIILIVFGYFSYNFFLQKSQPKPNKAIPEEDLFFLSEDQHKNVNLDELNFAEIKDKGPEFIYQLLVKNQVQIQDLYNKINNLHQELIKNQNRQQISKIAVNYFELHQKIFNNQNNESYQNILQQITAIELLLTENPDLQGNIDLIKSALPNFICQSQLLVELQAIIPRFQFFQNQSNEPSFFDKINEIITKFIVVRKIKNVEIDSVDDKINKLESALKQQNYTLSLQLFLPLYQAENTDLTKFYEHLKAMQQIEKADQEIMKIIKDLI